MALDNCELIYTFNTSELSSVWLSLLQMQYLHLGLGVTVLNFTVYSLMHCYGDSITPPKICLASFPGCHVGEEEKEPDTKVKGLLRSPRGAQLKEVQMWSAIGVGSKFEV